MDWAGRPVTIMEYITQSIVWVRLTMLEEETGSPVLIIG